MNLYEIEKNFNIPFVGVNQVKRLWKKGSLRFKNIFYFDHDKIRLAALRKERFGISPCIIYINPFSLLDQKSIFNGRCAERDYLLFSGNILQDGNFFQELITPPLAGYYLFYDMTGVCPENLSFSVEKKFKPVSLAIATQALISYFHYYGQEKYSIFPDSSYYSYNIKALNSHYLALKTFQFSAQTLEILSIDLISKEERIKFIMA